MNNYDDYDPEVHRSRVAKKQTESELSKEDQVILARERQEEYARLAQERKKSTSVYSLNKRTNKKSFKDKLEILQASMDNNKAIREENREKRKAAHEKSESIKDSAKKKMDRVAKESGIAEKTDEPGDKKYKINFIQILKLVICLGIVVCLLVLGYCAYIIHNAPEIDTSDVNSLLTQSSILYDDQGAIIDNVFGDKNRTLVEINDLPVYTQKAFIALEDKTFETHHGFNIVRIFGALKDALFNGGHISGTSTITQQLARNLYMEDIMQERSIKRKLIEAYYAVLLEKNLSKDQILEAYLNCVNFGDIYGIQTAAQTYFSKDVQDLSLAESAWLACIPQYPSAYKLIKTDSASTVTEETENLIYTNGKTAYLWNDAGKDRKNTCLYLMYEQGYITEEEYQEAKEVELKEIIKPTSETLNEVSNYFADYVITQVIADLQEEYDYDYSTAQRIVYNSGLQIYTTLDTTAQKVLEKEFDNNSNFPVPTSYRKDKDGNIIKENGSVLLYKYSNYIEDDETFKLKPSEYKWNDNGSLTIYKGKRLAIYNTTVNGTTDYSVEFRNMYYIEDDTFYSVPGGYLNIPQQYKSRDADENLVVSAQFFVDYPSFFTHDGDYLSTVDFSLRQKVVQPQAAMTIIDNKTGAIKAMIGGRQTSGRMLYNRATATRQPGSSIKPLAVYSSALQQSCDLANEGKLYTYTETGYDEQGTALWGDFITAASIVVDEKMKVNGEVWPKNTYRGYKGSYTFRRALQQSVNVCAIKILAQVGVDYAFDMVQRFGITTLVSEGANSDRNLAMGVGGLTNGVSTLEMASAYTTFVNGGVHKSYTCYTEVVTKSGDVLLDGESYETQVLDEGVAWIMRDILQTVVSQGIAGNAAISGQKVGGKTGTTDDSYDIWFDGFTANYTASLWIGNDVNIKLSSMSGKAASLWSKVMKQIPNAKGGKYSKKPSNVVSVTIDTDTGGLATDDSKHTRKEYFTEGTQPTHAVDDYMIEVCTETGFLATPDCEDTEIAYTSEYEEGCAPTTYCDLHNPDPLLYPTQSSGTFADEGDNYGEIIQNIPDPWSPEYDEWLANQNTEQTIDQTEQLEG